MSSTVLFWSTLHPITQVLSLFQDSVHVQCRHCTGSSSNCQHIFTMSNSTVLGGIPTFTSLLEHFLSVAFLHCNH